MQLPDPQCLGENIDSTEFWIFHTHSCTHVVERNAGESFATLCKQSSSAWIIELINLSISSECRTIHLQYLVFIYSNPESCSIIELVVNGISWKEQEKTKNRITRRNACPSTFLHVFGCHSIILVRLNLLAIVQFKILIATHTQHISRTAHPHPLMTSMKCYNLCVAN